MDRAYVQQLLANAKTRATRIVHLPVCGQDLELYTTLNRDQQLRIAASTSDEPDSSVQIMVNAFRFMLVHDGKLLLKSYAEAAAFVNALDPGDMQVLFNTLTEFAQEKRKSREAGGQAEAGK